jgi:hypothetical protein
VTLTVTISERSLVDFKKTILSEVTWEEALLLLTLRKKNHVAAESATECSIALFQRKKWTKTMAISKPTLVDFKNTTISEMTLEEVQLLIALRYASY